jgi:hypothetical protein
MDRYYIEVRYISPDTDHDDLDQHGDEMMTALQVEPNLVDPDVGVDFERHTVDVCAVVAADGPPAALRLALVAVRSAVHQVGGSTPGWESAAEHAVSSIRPSERVGN